MTLDETQFNPFAPPRPLEEVFVAESVDDNFGVITFSGQHTRASLEQIYARPKPSMLFMLSLYFATAVCVLAALAAILNISQFERALRGGGVLPSTLIVFAIGTYCFIGWGYVADLRFGNMGARYWKQERLRLPFTGMIRNDWCEVETENLTISFDPRVCAATFNEYAVIFSVSQTELDGPSMPVVLPISSFLDQQWQTVVNQFQVSKVGHQQIANKRSIVAPTTADAIAVRNVSKLWSKIFKRANDTWLASGAFIALLICGNYIWYVHRWFESYVLPVSFEKFLHHAEIEFAYYCSLFTVSISAALLLYCAALWFLVRKRALRLGKDKHQGIAWITDEAIWLQGNGCWIRHRWDENVQFANVPSGVKIFTRIPWNGLLPARAFESREEWEIAMKIIRTKAKKSRSIFSPSSK